MAGNSNVVSLAGDPHGDYPLAHSEATRMLAAALEEAQSTKGWNQRYVARALDYKTSVVLSHMASGRVPIPVDRAMDFARLLKMDAAKFLLAVLKQRHPAIDFERLLGGGTKRTSSKGVTSLILDELESLAGVQLDDLPQSQVDVLREAVSNPNAPRRWIALSELPTIELIRKMRPQGLSAADRLKLESFLKAL